MEYKPKNFENLNFKFVDQGKIPTWYGMSVFSSVLCFSPKLAEILWELPNPFHWKI